MDKVIRTDDNEFMFLNTGNAAAGGVDTLYRVYYESNNWKLEQITPMKQHKKNEVFLKAATNEAHYVKKIGDCDYIISNDAPGNSTTFTAADNANVIARMQEYTEINMAETEEIDFCLDPDNVDLVIQEVSLNEGAMVKASSSAFTKAGTHSASIEAVSPDSMELKFTQAAYDGLADGDILHFSVTYKDIGGVEATVNYVVHVEDIEEKTPDKVDGVAPDAELVLTFTGKKSNSNKTRELKFDIELPEHSAGDATKRIRLIQEDTGSNTIKTLKELSLADLNISTDGGSQSYTLNVDASNSKLVVYAEIDADFIRGPEDPTTHNLQGNVAESTQNTTVKKVKRNEDGTLTIVLVSIAVAAVGSQIIA